MVLAAGVLVLMLSHLATAQTSSSDPYSTGTDSTQVDCSDPLMANSSSCASSGQQNPNGASGSQLQNYGQPGALNGAASQQTQGSRPQNYNDTGDLTNQNQNQNVRGLTGQRLPPEPLTEFQKFVAGTTGQMLPIYGADLFQNAPSTFAPVDQTPVPPD